MLAAAGGVEQIPSFNGTRHNANEPSAANGLTVDEGNAIADNTLDDVQAATCVDYDELRSRVSVKYHGQTLEFTLTAGGSAVTDAGEMVGYVDLERLSRQTRVY